MTEVWKSLKPSNSCGCEHFPLSLETEVLRESGRKGQNGPGLTVFDWREAMEGEGRKLKQDWVHLYSCLRCSLNPANAATEIREGKQDRASSFQSSGVMEEGDTHRYARARLGRQDPKSHWYRSLLPTTIWNGSSELILTPLAAWERLGVEVRFKVLSVPQPKQPELGCAVCSLMEKHPQGALGQVGAT